MDVVIEFKCRKCGKLVAKRDGNLLHVAGMMMSLFNGGFAFDCKDCGEPFYFDFRKAGSLPTKGEISRPDGDKMMLAA